MSKSLKDTLIGTMRNGPEVLTELEIAKKIGQDIETKRGETGQKIREYHPESLRLIVAEKEQIDPLATRFRLVPAEGALPIFEAGQYVNLFFDLQGILTSRPYSIASAPGQRGYFEIIVARKKDGFVSDYMIDELKPGAVLKGIGPMGIFRYQPTHHKKHQVMLAGGSGITPMQSMVLDVLNRGLDRKITLFHGVRKLEYATNYQLFSELAQRHEQFTYIPVLSDEQNERFQHGFLNKELIRRYVPQPDDATFFLCGPEIMNSFCTRELVEMDVRRAMIRRELFQSRADIKNEPGWPEGLSPETEFDARCGGKQFKVKAGESLLAALERQRFDMHVGCRSGECSYCRMKLVSGQVFTAQGSLRRYADEVFGYIHSCKCYPVSDVELAF